MRAILIDPTEKTIAETDVAGDTRAMRPILDCRLAELVYLSSRDALFVDEEGLYTKKDFFRILPIEQPLPGRGLIFGLTREGALVDSTLTLSFAQAMVAWADVELAGFETLDGSTKADFFGTEVPVFGSKALFKKKVQP